MYIHIYSFLTKEEEKKNCLSLFTIRHAGSWVGTEQIPTRITWARPLELNKKEILLFSFFFFFSSIHLSSQRHHLQAHLHNRLDGLRTVGTRHPKDFFFPFFRFQRREFLSYLIGFESRRHPGVLLQSAAGIVVGLRVTQHVRAVRRRMLVMLMVTERMESRWPSQHQFVGRRVGQHRFGRRQRLRSRKRRVSGALRRLQRVVVAVGRASRWRLALVLVLLSGTFTVSAHFTVFFFTNVVQSTSDKREKKKIRNEENRLDLTCQ